MSVNYIGVGAKGEANNADITPGLPTGWQQGDLLIVLATARGNGTLGCTGYAQLFQEQFHTDNLHKVALFWKIAGASESAPTVTYTGGGSNQTVLGQMSAFRGTHTTNPMPDLGAISSNAAAADVGPITGFTPTLADADGAVIVFGHKADDWTSVAVLSGDGLTWAEIDEPDSTLGTDAGLVWDYALYAGSPPTVADKTFVVTGGNARTGVGRMLSIAKAVSAVNLAGMSDGVSDVVGIIICIRSLVGDSPAASGASAVLIAMILLVAESLAVSQGACVVRVLRGLAGASSGLSAAEGVLGTGQSVPLAGASDAVSSAVAGLSVWVGLVGSADGASFATGVIRRDVPLGTISEAQSQSTAAISVSRPLQGASAGLSDANGNVLIFRGLAGEAASTSTSDGVLTVQAVIQLSGASAGLSGSAGSVSVDRALAGSSPAVGGADGNLVLFPSLYGTAPGISDCGGVLSMDRRLPGGAGGVSDALAALIGTYLLLGQSVSQSQGWGVISIEGEEAEVGAAVWDE